MLGAVPLLWTILVVECLGMAVGQKDRGHGCECLLVGSFWNPVVGCVSGAQLAWFAHLQIELALVAPMSSRIRARGSYRD